MKTGVLMLIAAISVIGSTLPQSRGRGILDQMVAAHGGLERFRAVRSWHTVTATIGRWPGFPYPTGSSICPVVN